MAIPQSTADHILALCARHCCICRRFRPLHLQIHHIDERAEGGDDSFDNLIATCLTCHSDVHTQTRLTRRFTSRELKQHRDAVYKLVADGKLRGSNEPFDAWSQLSAAIVAQLRERPLADIPSATGELSAEAIELLLEAVRQDTPIHAIEYDGGFAVKIGPKTFGEDFNNRDAARYRHAISCLQDANLVSGTGSLIEVSYHGFILADELIAAGGDQGTG